MNEFDDIDPGIELDSQDEEAVSEGLYNISESLEKLDSGIVAGSPAYGAEWENNVFMMHPYCWCEGDDCEWCSGNKPNFWHKPSGFKVWWYKYIGRGTRVEGKIPDVESMVKECVASLSNVVVVNKRYDALMVYIDGVDKILDQLGVPKESDGIPLSIIGRFNWMQGLPEWEQIERTIFEWRQKNPTDDNVGGIGVFVVE